MTPECFPCGKVVDLVRSCHRGTWRLFSNPNILTRGRYYFAPPGAEWYDGFHPYGSSEWSMDANEVYTPPVLGEDNSLRLGYSRGEFGTVRPPGRMIGTARCVREGEQEYPAPNRLLIGGVDSRCWTDAGLPIPDQVPIIHLEPGKYRNWPASDRIQTWKDSSPSGYDATGASILGSPGSAVEPVTGLEIVVFFAGTVLFFPPLSLGVRHSAYVVSLPLPVLSIPGTGPWLRGGGTSGLLRHTGTFMSYVLPNLTSVTHADVLPAAERHIWSVRRGPVLARLFKDGVPIGSGAVDSTQRQFAGSIAQANSYPPTNGRVGIFEVLIFPSELTDAQDGAVIAALKARYAIP